MSFSVFLKLPKNLLRTPLKILCCCDADPLQHPSRLQGPLKVLEPSREPAKAHFPLLSSDQNHKHIPALPAGLHSVSRNVFPAEAVLFPPGAVENHCFRIILHPTNSEIKRTIGGE